MKSLQTYINEKLVVNKKYTDPNPTYINDKNDLKNNGWRKVKIEDVDNNYADVNIKSSSSSKRFYNKDGTPTNWFAWWMILCIYGPMSRKEMLRCCGLPEGSYSKTWVDMSTDNMIYYDTKRRVSCPNPMSEWTIWG